jgi:hypothetical protein
MRSLLSSGKTIPLVFTAGLHIQCNKRPEVLDWQSETSQFICKWVNVVLAICGSE